MVFWVKHALLVTFFCLCPICLFVLGFVLGFSWFHTIFLDLKMHADFHTGISLLPISHPVLTLWFPSFTTSLLILNASI